MTITECRIRTGPLDPAVVSAELRAMMQTWAEGLPSESVTVERTDDGPSWKPEPRFPAPGTTAIYRGVDMMGRTIGRPLELRWWYDYLRDELVVSRSEPPVPAGMAP